MKQELIKELFAKFEAACYEINTIECWSARELQMLLGYSKWENFEKVITKAKYACQNAGERSENHFPDVRKMVIIGSATEREVEDIALTRYACYLIAQNGDSRKEEIAFAQTYFAVQTHRAELVEQRLLEYVQTKDLKGQNPIDKEHIDNNTAVRKLLMERGIEPENLPPAEDVKKVKRKLKGEDKKILKNRLPLPLPSWKIYSITPSTMPCSPAMHISVLEAGL